MNGVIVLSGGNKINELGEIIPNEPVRRRLDLAERIWRQGAGTGLIITTTLYSPNLPPLLDRDGYPVTESEAMADYLIKIGVPPEHIRLEKASVCTLSNLYFALQICAVYGITHVTIVTSAFHATKTEGLASFVFSLEGVKITHDIKYSFDCEDLSAEGMVERKRRDEEAVIKITARLREFGVEDLPGLYRYILETHHAYAAGMKPARMTRAEAEKLGY